MNPKFKRQLQDFKYAAGYNIGRGIMATGRKLESVQEKLRQKRKVKRHITSPRSVLITGATSGIGAEMALQYAAPGVFLYLTGRNQKRLEEVAVACVGRGAKVETKSMDICDDVAVEQWIKSLPRIDLAIANAGVSGGTAEGVDNDEVREIFSVNVGGVINTVLPMIEKARKQQLVDGSRGHIAIMASMAAFHALPGAPAYSASKACVSTYADALRGALRHEKIHITSIHPGYIRTPLTATNPFYMPMLMEPEEAVYRIRKGLWKRKARINFPLPIYFLLRFVNMLPLVVTDPIFRKFPKKA